VLFIATANVSHTIPPALKDRMEIIQLSGYTPNEKQAIAKGFLVPKQVELNGLDPKRIRFTEEGIKKLIDSYTREAGVRNLEREIGSVCRKLARRVVEGEPALELEVDADVVTSVLGKERYRTRRGLEESEVGVATGLAWTEVGGELLESEVGLMKGKGKLILTGKLGEVMQESARAALSYLRSRSKALDIDPRVTEECDIHIHVPEGAIPKDGPSAGITMATALISAISELPVRKDVAMTGEITLRGKVLPVGGIKDKALAAFRAGIHEIILPLENEKDLEEIPHEIRDAMRVHLVSSMDQVLEIALDRSGGALPRPTSELPEIQVETPVDPGSVAH
jgi:ATP-dependent Lon protease